MRLHICLHVHLHMRLHIYACTYACTHACTCASPLHDKVAPRAPSLSRTPPHKAARPPRQPRHITHTWLAPVHTCMCICACGPEGRPPLTFPPPAHPHSSPASPPWAVGADRISRRLRRRLAGARISPPWAQIGSPPPWPEGDRIWPRRRHVTSRGPLGGGRSNLASAEM